MATSNNSSVTLIPRGNIRPNTIGVGGGKGGGGGAVNSVNGKTGNVILDAEDVGALPDNTPLFSGDYNDLSNKPIIPTVNNSTITIQKNGQNVDTFTLNQDTNKAIDISVPTKTSDLQNDNSFITNTVNNLANYYLKTQTYTQAEVDALIQAVVNGRFQKVNALPASGEPNIIYLVPKTAPEISNACDEYIWQDNAWELIGSTEIDLSNYVTDEDLAAALTDYITTSAFNTVIANYYTKTEIGNLLDNKVDKVPGKGLSTNDYTNADKAKLDGIHEYTTLEGNPLIFTTDSVQIAKDAVITINPIQSGSGDPSPNNNRPISGRSEIGILGVGKNLVDLPNLNLPGAGWAFSGIECKLKAGVYTFSLDFTGAQNTTQIIFYKEDRVTQVGTKVFDLIPGERNAATAIIIAEDCSYLGYYVNSAGAYINFQIEKGYTATTYEPYIKSTDLTIQLGEMIYGGTLDVKNGVLVVDSRKDIFKWSAGIIIPADTPDGYTRKSFTLINFMDRRYTTSEAKSNIAKLHYIWPPINEFYIERGNLVIGLPDATDGNTDIEIWYKIATPITIQLTPNEISLLYGINYITTTADFIKLTYSEGVLATLDDLTSAVDTLNSKIDESKILTDTVTGDKYILVVTNGTLSIQQVSS